MNLPRPSIRLFFLECCQELLIDPNVALENEDVLVAYKTGEFENLRAALEENF